MSDYPGLTLFDLVSARAAYELSLADYSPIRQVYAIEVKGAITEYLYTEGVAITRFRNAMKRAIANAFNDAFAQGFADGGGGEYPYDAPEAAINWLTTRMDAEFGFVDGLFHDLREIKRAAQEENDPGQLDGVADQHAEAYAKTLDGVYSQAKMFGARDKMLTFGGNSGAESCKDCQRLMNQRHKASWWVRRGLVPGQPGNRHFECGGWRCQHFLFDDNGVVFTA